MKYTKPLLSMLCAGIALQPAHTQSMSWLYDTINEQSTGTKIIFGTVTAATLCTLGCFAAKKLNTKKLHWNWQDVDNKKVDELVVAGQPIAHVFKNRAQNNQWIWGTATASYQTEGRYEKNGKVACSQWDKFAREGKTLKHENGEIRPVKDPGIACDHWNRYADDIAKMEEIGANGYRFSIAWEKVCLEKPRLCADGSMNPHDINEDALQHYENVCQLLVQKGIRPAITLYHYAEPEWFYDLGGFEKKENIPYFVAFCKLVAQRLQKYNPLWFTFNAAEGHATQGWLKGMKPPAKENQYKMVAQVLFNLLQSHVLVYNEIHKIDANAQVGILKNILQLDPYRPWHPLDNLFAYLGNQLVNDSVYTFFKTGKFSVYLPTKVSYSNESKEMKALIKQGKHALDFVGLNYYCHAYMKGTKTVPESDATLEPRTNNPRYPIYGEGLFRAIKEISEQMARPCGNIPIYVTENGVAANNDEHGNKIRELHNKRYIYAMALAIQHGYDVRGYFHWSFMDNYEWGSYGKNYGIFEVDRTNDDLTRIPKSGAQFLIDLIERTFAQ